MPYPCQGRHDCRRPAYFLVAASVLTSWEEPMCRRCTLDFLQQPGTRRVRGVDPLHLERLAPYVQRRHP